MVDLVYMNQGAENGGWVTEDFLRAVGAAVPGLDVDRDARGERLGRGDGCRRGRCGGRARRRRRLSRPRSCSGETGGELSPLEISSLGPEEFRAAIDELLDG